MAKLRAFDRNDARAKDWNAYRDFEPAKVMRVASDADWWRVICSVAAELRAICRALACYWLVLLACDW